MTKARETEARGLSVYDPMVARIFDAEPGTKIVYFSGPSLHCAWDGAGRATPQKRRALALKLAAWDCYSRGLCELVQRRNENGEFDYIAVRRKVVRAVLDKAA